MTEKERTLKETKEMHVFIMGVLDSAEDSKEDGKITSMEWMQNAMTNAPKAVKAFMGASEIDDELKNLNEKEMLEVAKMGMELMKGFSSLFGGK